MAEVETKTARNRRPKRSKTVPAVVEAGPSNVPDPPDPRETKVSEQAEHKAGRPPKDGLNFFQRLGHYPKTEWEGGKLVIYSYRIEPFTDRYQGGNRYVFLLKYTSPIDEERILLDHGSGKYHFKLNRAEEGQSKTRPIDAVDIEILNPKYPPKVPEGEWVDDPRNKKWAWAAPKGSAAATAAAAPSNSVTGSTDPFEALRIVNEIQESGMDRVKPAGESSTSILEAIRLGRDLSTPVKATEDSTLKAILEMNRDMMTQAREEAKELRAELRAIRERPGTPPVDPVAMLTTTIDKLTPLVEKLFPNIKKAGEEVVEKAVRSRMGSWQEFFAPVLPGVVDLLKPVIGTIAQGILMSSQTNPGTPLNGTGPKPAAQPGAAGGTVADLLNVITPVMIGYVRDEADGGAFADWMESGWGMEKLDQVRAATVDQMIAFLQRTHWWNNKGKGGAEPSLAEMQPRLRGFLQEFMSWSPDTEEDTETGEEAPVIDLMADSAESVMI